MLRVLTEVVNINKYNPQNSVPAQHLFILFYVILYLCYILFYVWIDIGLD